MPSIRNLNWPFDEAAHLMVDPEDAPSTTAIDRRRPIEPKDDDRSTPRTLLTRVLFLSAKRDTLSAGAFGHSRQTDVTARSGNTRRWLLASIPPRWPDRQSETALPAPALLLWEQ